MFTNILLPTDGSSTSEKAIKGGIALAKATGGAVTGLYVMPPFNVLSYNTEMLEGTASQLARDCEAHAKEFLAVIQATADAAGVPCTTIQTTSEHPFEAIIDAATEAKCDLIAMASHGRKGIKGLLLGSETQKVLMHSTIPVLVYR